jgi:hypothetical protein
VGNNYGDISDCYATGNIKATIYKEYGRCNAGGGGLAGWSSVGNITNCYATGNVTGIVDETDFGWNSKNYYFYGGGLVGHISTGESPGTRIANCYFLQETNGVNSGLKGVGEGPNEGVSPRSLLQMKSRNGFPGFDFTSVWGIREGDSFPFLLNVAENVTPPVANRWILPENANLHAYVDGGMLRISGLKPGEWIYVYSIRGQQVCGGYAAGTEHYIPLPAEKGVYIVVVGRESIKVVY